MQSKTAAKVPSEILSHMQDIRLSFKALPPYFQHRVLVQLLEEHLWYASEGKTDIDWWEKNGSEWQLRLLLK